MLYAFHLADFQGYSSLGTLASPFHYFFFLELVIYHIVGCGEQFLAGFVRLFLQVSRYQVTLSFILAYFSDTGNFQDSGKPIQPQKYPCRG